MHLKHTYKQKLLLLKHAKLNSLAAQLKGLTLSETEKNEMAIDEADNASVQQKEPINSPAQVCWYRQEQQQTPECLTVIQSEVIRSEAIKSAELSEPGVYTYETKDTNILSTGDPPGDSSIIFDISTHLITILTPSVMQW